MSQANVILRKTTHGIRAFPIFQEEFDRLMKAGRLRKVRNGSRLYEEVESVVEEQTYKTRDMQAERQVPSRRSSRTRRVRRRQEDQEDVE